MHCLHLWELVVKNSHVFLFFNQNFWHLQRHCKTLHFDELKKGNWIVLIFSNTYMKAWNMCFLIWVPFWDHSHDLAIQWILCFIRDYVIIAKTMGKTYWIARRLFNNLTSQMPGKRDLEATVWVLVRDHISLIPHCKMSGWEYLFSYE